MFAASKTAAAAAGTPPPSTDPQFNYVTMLLHGDGTNGAQNNTFVDSSTNNFTITRNGTPTQGSFSPYGDLWGNYITSGQRLTVAANTALNITGGAFTLEAWVYPTSFSTPPLIFVQDNGYGNSQCFQFRLEQTNGKLGFIYWTSSSRSSAVGVTTTNSTVLNQWSHVAAVYTGSTLYLFIDGVMGFSGSVASMFSASIPTTIGNFTETLNNVPLNGYISNVRIVKGTALYTSAFTPSTTPLTAVSGTSLLTCQSNRFRDNSSNNFAITVTGTPSVQRFSPFDPAAEYSTSVIGGSGYFPGATSGLRTNFQPITTGPFTIEFWINPASYKSTMITVGNRAWNFGNNRGWWVEMNSTGQVILKAGQGGFASWPTILTSSGTVPLNQWTHVACVRDSSNVIRFYINGVADSTTVTYSASLDQSNGTPAGTFCTIGVEYSDNAYQSSTIFIGYISNVRINPTNAVYTTTFTPPTAPLTAITNTSLLLNTVNAGIFDNAMMNDLVTVGNAQVSTAVKKYGTGSMYFDGSGDYLLSNIGPQAEIGSGNFTIEGWVNASSWGFINHIIDFRPASTNGAYPQLYIDSAGKFTFGNPANITGTTIISTGVWYHIAVCRSGTSTKMFVNGIQEGATYTDTTVYLVGASRPAIGSNGFTVGQTVWHGYIDDLRITKGIARYTANFTPPTAALPNN